MTTKKAPYWRDMTPEEIRAYFRRFEVRLAIFYWSIVALAVLYWCAVRWAW